MKTRTLGTEGLAVSSVGLGCMGMSDFYGSHNDTDSMATLQAAIDAGVTFWDTSDAYGPCTNEALLGRFFADHPGARDQVVLATKFGILRNANGDFTGFDGRPEYLQEACDASLQRLGIDHIDLYYQHRMDPEVPIEDTVGAMAELVKQGKIRYLGLSEASASTLERASNVHPISALQSEYSLWSRHLEASVLPTCKQLGVGLVSYSPLGRGFLTGAIQSRNDLEEGDWRLQNPRFSEANFQQNLVLVDRIKEMALEKQCTPAQLALAWILHQGPDYVSIPGTRSPARVQENAKAMEITLSSQELAQIASNISSDLVFGQRYPEPMMSALER